MKQGFGVLRQFIKEKEPQEQCDLCSLGLPSQHQHLIEPSSRKIVCSCDACSILFSDQQGAKFRRIPRDSRILTDFHLTNEQWDELLIPISMAFFFFSSMHNKFIVLYPSPAGATESLLRLDSWNDVIQQNPVLQKMNPDVEALLVNRMPKEPEYFITPIDQCFKLVGLIRSKWKGLSGGTDVWKEIYQFFETLKQNSLVLNSGDTALRSIINNA